MMTEMDAELSRPRDARAIVQLHVWIRRALWRRVRRQCARESRKLRSFVAEALVEHLAERQRSGPRRAPRAPAAQARPRF